MKKITQQEAEYNINKRCDELNSTLIEPFIMNGVDKSILYLKCNIDNYKWSLSYYNFINRKQKCPKCNGNLKLTQTEVENNINKRCKEMNYTITKKFIYNSNKTRLYLKCNKCNYKWNSMYFSIINLNTGCPNCSHNLKLTYTLAESKLLVRCKEMNYDLLYPIIINNAKSKINIKCKKCDNIWQPTYDHFVNEKTNCPTCKQSRGELKIKEYLTKNYKDLYICQKRFKECKNIKTLPFDFYLDKYKIAIEYQGKQHYFNSYYTRNDSNNISKRDNIKRKFCKDNNIYLIEISYIIKNQNIYHSLDVYFEYYFNCMKNLGYIL